MANVLFVVGGGIGNIVQATPAINLLHQEGHQIDLKLHCNSSGDIREIFSLPSVRNVFVKNEPREDYDFQLNGPFTPGKKYQAKVFYKDRNYAKHVPEAHLYLRLISQLHVKGTLGDCAINIGRKGPTPQHPDTIAIYPGSKPNWAMKRWNKYDHLARMFKHVVLVGKKEDIYSHGIPTWIRRRWDWPAGVEIKQRELQEIAFFISHCQAYIGNDGGLSHVAAATGIPTFVIFGPSSVRKNLPYANNAHAIGLNLRCQPCQFRKGDVYFDANKGNCPFKMRCMDKLSVSYVYKRIKTILESKL